MTNKRYLYTSPPISSPSLSLYQGLSQNSRLPLNPLANQNVLYQTCTIFRYTHMAEHTAGNCSPKNHPTQSSHCLPNIYQIKCYFSYWGGSCLYQITLFCWSWRLMWHQEKRESNTKFIFQTPFLGLHLGFQEGKSPILAFRRVNHQPLLTCFHGQQSTNHIP